MALFRLTTPDGKTIFEEDHENRAHARSHFWHLWVKKFRKSDDSGWKRTQPCHFYQCPIEEAP